jgi:hypothetical protein
MDEGSLQVTSNFTFRVAIKIFNLLVLLHVRSDDQDDYSDVQPTALRSGQRINDFTFRITIKTSRRAIFFLFNMIFSMFCLSFG